MTISPNKSLSKLTLCAVTLLAVSACSDSDNLPSTSNPQPSPASKEYVVTVTNLTAAQPFSPPNLVIHDENTYLWKQGVAASVALEKVAEGGDGSDLSSLNGVTQVFTADAPLPPGEKKEYTLKVLDTQNGYLSAVTMLVNTNDAFTGMQRVPIMGMQLNETRHARIFAYDAGTEVNTEASGTMPGPADNGVGFVAERPDGTAASNFEQNLVHVHPGVISNADGLTTSVLAYSHKFDTPVVDIRVKRTK